uniref:Secreted protein n=1 Tax=Lepeophtheirus salmonis TaxID=72036 RepID=A0A0K2VGF8_LEPSM
MVSMGCWLVALLFVLKFLDLGGMGGGDLSLNKKTSPLFTCLFEVEAWPLSVTDSLTLFLLRILGTATVAWLNETVSASRKGGSNTLGLATSLSGTKTDEFEVLMTARLDDPDGFTTMSL